MDYLNNKECKCIVTIVSNDYPVGTKKITTNSCWLLCDSCMQMYNDLAFYYAGLTDVNVCMFVKRIHLNNNLPEGSGSDGTIIFYMKSTISVSQALYS